MTKTTKIILFLALLILVGYLILNFVCKIGIKCEQCPLRSLSIEESKKRNLFVTTYKPLTDKIKLRYHNDTVEFTTGWVENSWFQNSDICLWKKIEKSGRLNLTIEFGKEPSDNFNFHDDYGRVWLRHTEIGQLTDTLTFQIVEKNPNRNIGWQEELKSERIKFVRMK